MTLEDMIGKPYVANLVSSATENALIFGTVESIIEGEPGDHIGRVRIQTKHGRFFNCLSDNLVPIKTFRDSQIGLGTAVGPYERHMQERSQDPAVRRLDENMRQMFAPEEKKATCIPGRLAKLQVSDDGENFKDVDLGIAPDDPVRLMDQKNPCVMPEESNWTRLTDANGNRWVSITNIGNAGIDRMIKDRTPLAVIARTINPRSGGEYDAVERFIFVKRKDAKVGMRSIENGKYAMRPFRQIWNLANSHGQFIDVVLNGKPATIRMRSALFVLAKTDDRAKCVDQAEMRLGHTL